MTPIRILCLLVCIELTHGCLRVGTGSGGGDTVVGSNSGDNGQDSGGESGELGGGTNDDGDDSNNVGLPGCPTIIARSQWGARSPKSQTGMKSTPLYAVIHHGAGSRCYTEDKCKKTVQGYQNYHMDTRKWVDIGYNFIVGEDGNVYEGRGWGIRGAHAGTVDSNEKSLGICVIGDFSSTVPNLIAQNTVKQLIACAESNKKLASTYTIRAHRDLKSTSCPGERFYDLIKTWHRYSESDGIDVDSTNDLKFATCPTIISRSEWDARAPRSRTPMSSTPSYVLIHHGTGAGCDTKSACISKVQAYQKQHMDTNNWSDIGYNFIVGEDGNVYEGRGWGITGAHAGVTLYNKNSLGICVIGDFSNTVPNLAAQSAIKQLISCAVANNKLTSTYKLRGHQDVRSTKCPGTSFYNLIKTWNRY
ncbi:peptidoglycan recognition protein 3-like isoform X2 [Mercenaria mercenaria]|nr:peptidoglycan recognition protein 3-like isoform X2 [Mercenaria mercenaria]